MKSAHGRLRPGRRASGGQGIFTVDADFNNLTWYGHGPAETYADRDHAKLGVYRSGVVDTVAGYLVPQESGNHTEVRWAEITDDLGRGIRVEGDKFSLSVSPGHLTRSITRFIPMNCPRCSIHISVSALPRWASAVTTPGALSFTRSTGSTTQSLWILHLHSGEYNDLVCEMAHASIGRWATN